MALSPKDIIRRALARCGYELRKITPPGYPQPAHRDVPTSPYLERAEVGPRNLADKLQRQASGGPFEWPDILALNKTVAGMIGGARRIVELGSGTGAFAVEAAANPDVQLTCSEFDVECCNWAARNRSRPNIRYVPGPVAATDGPFDLLVSIEVIEHVEDFVGFLRVCASLAPRAILTTPNKARDAAAAFAEPPAYYQHVREWTAGEFYWVLRCFYRDVKLYAMPDPNVPGAVPIRVTDTLSPLIADCETPLNQGATP